MEHAEQVAAEIVQKLERAWNSADGTAWAELFSEDADFVTVRGEYFRSRTAIAQGHQAIFDTIYKSSVNRYELLRTRALGDDVIVAHVFARLSVPTGPLAGEHQAVFSIVVARAEGAWQIVSLHNTFRTDEAFGREQALDRWQDHAARESARDSS